MASSALFFLVVLIALVVHCEGFTLQTGLSRMATASIFEDSSIKRSPVRNIMMTTIESVSNQVQLGRVTMYKKEGA
jgi:hypothetical protein